MDEGDKGMTGLALSASSRVTAPAAASAAAVGSHMDRVWFRVARLGDASSAARVPLLLSLLASLQQTFTDTPYRGESPPPPQPLATPT